MALLAACGTTRLSKFHDSIGRRVIYQESYADMAGNLFAHVVHIKPADLRMMEELYCDKVYCTQAELQESLAAVEAQVQGLIYFFAAVYTREPLWNHLQRTDCPFRFVLVQGGKVVKPQKVERKAAQMRKYRYLFPFLNGFFKPYLISFPAASVDTTAALKLVITGVPGTLEFGWKMLE